MHARKPVERAEELLLDDLRFHVALVAARRVELVQLEDEVVKGGMEGVDLEDVVVLPNDGVVVLDDAEGQDHRGAPDGQPAQDQQGEEQGQSPADASFELPAMARRHSGRTH